jgi:NADPH:quinone reductase-like Zn-dependent oxidoreductase
LEIPTNSQSESPKPGAREVKVRVHSVAVNFHDTLLVRGLYQIKPDFPFIPGSDASGEVLVARLPGPTNESASIGKTNTILPEFHRY